MSSSIWCLCSLFLQAWTILVPWIGCKCMAFNLLLSLTFSSLTLLFPLAYIGCCNYLCLLINLFPLPSPQFWYCSSTYIIQLKAFTQGKNRRWMHSTLLSGVKGEREYSILDNWVWTKCIFSSKFGTSDLKRSISDECFSYI